MKDVPWGDYEFEVHVRGSTLVSVVDNYILKVTMVDPCSADGGLIITKTQPDDMNEYHSPANIELNLASFYSSNKPTDCPIERYDCLCKTDGKECIDASSVCFSTLDKATGAWSFQRTSAETRPVGNYQF